MEAYESLLRGHALGYAARHGGFGCGDGVGRQNGHECLAAVLTSLARNKARLEEMEKRHARAADAAAKLTGEALLRSQTRRKEAVRLARGPNVCEEDDDGARSVAAAAEAEAARRAAIAREELAEAEARTSIEYPVHR